MKRLVLILLVVLGLTLIAVYAEPEPKTDGGCSDDLRSRCSDKPLIMDIPMPDGK